MGASGAAVLWDGRGGEGDESRYLWIRRVMLEGHLPKSLALQVHGQGLLHGLPNSGWARLPVALDFELCMSG